MPQAAVGLLGLLATSANRRKPTTQRRTTVILFAAHLITFQGGDMDKSGEQVVRKDELGLTMPQNSPVLFSQVC